MDFIHRTVSDIVLIQPKVFGDSRGFFMETYQARLFAEAGLPTDYLQDNHSGSVRGTLRGLHYQIRQAQGKLVRVVAGEVFDVAVDIRRSSPTFGQFECAVLSAENKYQLWIPPGFAHGFYVLSEWAELVYKATDLYAPQWERAIAWNDPEIGIPWPLIEGLEPLLSAKDAKGVPLREAEVYS